MTKIGVGVTTFNRPEHIDLFCRQMNIHSPSVKIYIAHDTNEHRRGVAYRKNECLHNLSECDYIFLFDDDCFPIQDGWEKFFIEAHKRSGQHHFLYLKETGTIQKIKTENGIEIFNNCGGCFMFLTRDVLTTVGAFNKSYGIYGWEHAGYSLRIQKAGLNTMGAYLCPEGAGDYIYSLDYDNHRKYIKHYPSMAKEIKKLPQYMQRNYEVFNQDTNIYQPL